MNIRALFLIFVIFSYTHFNAQTVIPGGVVSGTWTSSGSPYLIQNAIMIPDDSTLIIDPGVIISFQGHFKFLVLGRLLAEGTQNDSILFTANDTTIGWLGIRFDNTLVTNDSSKFSYCKFEYGRATSSIPDNNGGALWFDNVSKVVVSNSLITKCYANFAGAGIYCDNGSSPIIKNNTIIKNKCVKGGGIYCFNNSDPLIIDNNISFNIADDGTNNGAGGGIYCYDNSSPIIKGNSILNNTAGGGRGGGIFNVLSSIIISNNIIKNNNAHQGGGIYMGGGNLEIVKYNFISNNTATYGGGGIKCTGGNFYSNVIVNNSANVYGGGVLSEVADPYFENNTILNNSANMGNALCCANNSNPTFINTIIWSTILGKQIYLNDESSDPTFKYCDIQLGISGIEVNSNVFYLGVFFNNINVNPDIINASLGNGVAFDGMLANWSLNSTSQCINSGDPNGVYTGFDINGNPRVFGVNVDIGAYEVSSISNLSEVGIKKVEFQQLQIYPTPFIIETKIKFNVYQNNSIVKIIDLRGIEVAKFNFTGEVLILPKGNMKTGNYFIYVYDYENNNYYTGKFVIL